MSAYFRTFTLSFCALGLAIAQDGAVSTPRLETKGDFPSQRLQSATTVENNQPTYYWRVTAVDGTAQLLTLFCHSSSAASRQPEELPLVAVLRDTLGDNDPENDRLTSVWLLTYARSDFGQKLLSAVPFFYWRVGQGSKSVNDTAPLIDLTAPEHPVVSEVGRNIFQWTILDPATTTIRAASRAYRTNQLDYERLHLEEAAAYLRHAPAAFDSSGLTRAQIDTVIARLELRKKLLGGFVSQRRAANLGEESGFEQERIRSRNWELLRQCAERTGLIFEPLDLAGATGQYAMLWFPRGQSSPPAGPSLDPVWKILKIRDPWPDDRLAHWKGAVYVRSLNDSGGLLPKDKPGTQQIQLVPLGIYSLSYPTSPLLLVDFRDKLHVRRHEMTQRSINEITAGVIGISHFTNWYYYVAADLYDFVAGRHGSATNQAARLDCYAQFEVALALDQQLDPALRDELHRRINGLAVNPLEAAPAHELQLAVARYASLQQEAGIQGKLEERLDKQRRSEIVSFEETKKARLAEAVLHDASLGLYTHRARKGDDTLATLDRDRRIQYDLCFLDGLVHAGTQPEVTYDTSRIRDSVTELGSLMSGPIPQQLRTHAAATLQQLGTLSRDRELQADCSDALTALNRNAPVSTQPSLGIVSSTRSLAHPTDAVEPVK